MNKQRLGLTLFWIGTIYMLIAAGIGGWGAVNFAAGKMAAFAA